MNYRVIASVARSSVKLCRSNNYNNARAIFTATRSIPASVDISAAGPLEWSPYAGSEGATLDKLKSNYDTRSAIPGNCLRSSTAAVASRLTQQTQFPLIPGTPFTLDGAMNFNPLKQPRLIATPGHRARVVFANEEWSKLCGFDEEELKDMTGIEALTGPGTDVHTKQLIVDALENQTRLHVTVINFAKDGIPFLMQLQLSPLLNKNGNVSHMLASVKHI